VHVYAYVVQDAVLGLSALEVSGLRQAEDAVALLIKEPLKRLGGQRVVILFDALDEVSDASQQPRAPQLLAAGPRRAAHAPCLACCAR
jgi:hypothetical protein